MDKPDLIELFVRPLNQAGIRYLVSGSVAAMFYGEPRITHDIDFLVFLRSSDVQALPGIFPSPEFYVPPPEAIHLEVSRERHGQFNVIHPDSALKADFFIAKHDELDAWGFRNARKYSFEGTDVRLAPPEYVIVRKLEFFKQGGSEKHVRDIRAMLLVSEEIISCAEIDEWAGRRGLEEVWRKVRGESASAPASKV